MPDVTMPRLSDSMEEGTILRWLKSDGDEVSAGDELAEIETDKATMTFEAEDSGVLSLVASEGDTLPIGEVIARIGEGSSSSSSDDADDEPAEDEGAESGADGDGSEQGGSDAETEEPAAEEDEAPKDEPAEAPKAESASSNGGGGDSSSAEERIKASPVARRIAREKGIKLDSIQGTGPGGRIVKADVEGAGSGAQGKDAGAPEAPPAEEPKKDAPKKKDVPPPVVTEKGTAKGDVTIEELTRTQQVVARRMAESKATVPDFAISTTIDMERAVAHRAELKRLADPAPSYNDMIVKACALALREFPRANGSYKDGKFELYSRVNVGIAVAAQDSLVVPTIHDADKKGLGEIAKTSRALAERVREGVVTPPELSGGTFTVSNLGMYGITEFVAVINPPQAAILAVGAMNQRPTVIDGELTIRHQMNVTLVCDHRILYGADAAQFLARIRELLEEPLMLAL